LPTAQQQRYVYCYILKFKNVAEFHSKKGSVTSERRKRPYYCDSKDCHNVHI